MRTQKEQLGEHKGLTEDERRFYINYLKVAESMQKARQIRRG